MHGNEKDAVWCCCVAIGANPFDCLARLKAVNLSRGSGHDQCLCLVQSGENADPVRSSSCSLHALDFEFCCVFFDHEEHAIGLAVRTKMTDGEKVLRSA